MTIPRTPIIVTQAKIFQGAMPRRRRPNREPSDSAERSLRIRISFDMHGNSGGQLTINAKSAEVLFTPVPDTRSSFVRGNTDFQRLQPYPHRQAGFRLRTSGL